MRDSADLRRIINNNPSYYLQQASTRSSEAEIEKREVTLDKKWERANSWENCDFTLALPCSNKVQVETG